MRESKTQAAAPTPVLVPVLALMLAFSPFAVFGEETLSGSAAEASTAAAAAEVVTEPERAAVDAAVTTQADEAAVDAERRIPETLKHKDRAVTVMDVALDGSSLDTFNEGLARVEQEATPEEYRRLHAALDRLLFYDISAKRNREVLYQRLSGKTPNQIIAQAGQR